MKIVEYHTSLGHYMKNTKRSGGSSGSLVLQELDGMSFGEGNENH